MIRVSKFAKYDLVAPKISIINKLIVFLRTGRWLPNTLIVIGWRDDMIAYSCIDKVGNEWFVTEEKLL